MPEENQEFQDFSQQQGYSAASVSVRDLEEKQRLTKERMLLIGENLIDLREKTELELAELKKDMNILKTDMRRMKEVLASISEEMSKMARKEEVMILERQFQMFEPLEFARMKDIEKAMTKKQSKKTRKSKKLKEPEIKEYVKKFWEGKI